MYLNIHPCAFGNQLHHILNVVIISIQSKDDSCHVESLKMRERRFDFWFRFLLFLCFPIFLFLLKSHFNHHFFQLFFPLYFPYGKFFRINYRLFFCSNSICLFFLDLIILFIYLSISRPRSFFWSPECCHRRRPKYKANSLNFLVI